MVLAQATGIGQTGGGQGNPPPIRELVALERDALSSAATRRDFGVEQEGAWSWMGNCGGEAGRVAIYGLLPPPSIVEGIAGKWLRGQVDLNAGGLPAIGCC